PSLRSFPTRRSSDLLYTAWPYALPRRSNHRTVRSIGLEVGSDHVLKRFRVSDQHPVSDELQLRERVAGRVCLPSSVLHRGNLQDVRRSLHALLVNGQDQLRNSADLSLHP